TAKSRFTSGRSSSLPSADRQNGSQAPCRSEAYVTRVPSEVQIGPSVRILGVRRLDVPGPTSYTHISSPLCPATLDPSGEYFAEASVSESNNGCGYGSLCPRRSRKTMVPSTPLKPPAGMVTSTPFLETAYSADPSIKSD